MATSSNVTSSWYGYRYIESSSDKLDAKEKHSAQPKWYNANKRLTAMAMMMPKPQRCSYIVFVPRRKQPLVERSGKNDGVGRSLKNEGVFSLRTRICCCCRISIQSTILFGRLCKGFVIRVISRLFRWNFCWVENLSLPQRFRSFISYWSFVPLY